MRVLAKRVSALLAATWEERKAQDAEHLHKAIHKTLLAHGFKKKRGTDSYVYPGSLMTTHSAKLHHAMTSLGLERSPALKHWSWYDRHKGKLVHLTHRDGEYSAHIKNV